MERGGGRGRRETSERCNHLEIRGRLGIGLEDSGQPNEHQLGNTKKIFGVCVRQRFVETTCHFVERWMFSCFAVSLRCGPREEKELKKHKIHDNFSNVIRTENENQPSFSPYGTRLALLLLHVKRCDVSLIPRTTHGCRVVFCLVTAFPCHDWATFARCLPWKQ